MMMVFLSMPSSLSLARILTMPLSMCLIMAAYVGLFWTVLNEPLPMVTMSLSVLPLATSRPSILILAANCFVVFLGASSGVWTA